MQGIGTADDNASGLTKVVLARRSDVEFRGTLDPLLLLAALQERDPRAYQFCVQLPDGAAFLGSSPEQLYSRTGRRIASEAVAATRPRGPPGESSLPPCLSSTQYPKVKEAAVGPVVC